MVASDGPVRQFTRHEGIAAAFLQPDVEGELIAPLGPELHDLHDVHRDPGAAEIETHAHDGSWEGQHAFQGFRYRLDGSENPDFVLNQPAYRDASILIAGRNFGLGSLQGFAVIRLMQCGMRVVIAPSFGPVFYDDCFDFGLLPITLEAHVLEMLVEQVEVDPRVETAVDLVSQTVERAGAPSISFEIDARRRATLLTGADPSLEERLEHADSAAAMRARDRRARPWLYPR